MKKCLLNAAMIVVSLITLNACCTILPGKVIYSDSLKSTIEDVNAKAALLVTADGKVLVYNEKGDQTYIRECKIPEPVEIPVDEKGLEAPDRSDASQVVQVTYPDDVCTGLRTGSAITNIQTLTILKSNSKNCVIIGKTQSGKPKERCW